MSFIVTIILARLLTPEDFGLIAMVLIFFQLSSVFVEGGFSTALIRKKQISDIQKSTTFIFNLITAIIVYILLFTTAPIIADFFNQESLVPLIRVMAIIIVINSIAIIQRATLTQEIDFKKQTLVRIIAVLISGIIAITMAIKGFGVWSLVAQLIIKELVATVLLWFWSPWRLSFRFSKSVFKELFGFGSKILVIAIIDKFYNQIFNILIGRFYPVSTLGFYSQATTLSNVFIVNFYSTLQRVTYPVLSKFQDDIPKLRNGYRLLIKVSTFAIVPILVLLAVLAEPFIITVVGNKWLPAVPFLQLLCIAGITHHLNSLNFNILLVVGRPDLSLKLEIYKKINITIGIIIGIQFGIYGLVISQVVTAYIAILINSYYSKLLIDYSIIDQLFDIKRSFLFAIAMGLAVFFIYTNSEASNMFQLLTGFTFGLVIYVGMHLISQSEEIIFLKSKVIPRAIHVITREAFPTKG